MRITLILTGRTTDERLQSLIDDYTRRLTHYVPFELVVLPDIKNAKSLSQEQLKAAEGQAILAALTNHQSPIANSTVILMDEHGAERRSMEYAEWLQKKMSGGRDLTFVIGGPYGFSPAVYERADGKMSLSQMTFSHQMVRLFFVEQLYRAFTILRHEPYHHE